eukprot:12921210-Alexandrium_andersonii.AAC.1
MVPKAPRLGRLRRHPKLQGLRGLGRAGGFRDIQWPESFEGSQVSEGDPKAPRGGGACMRACVRAIVHARVRARMHARVHACTLAC